MKTYEVIDTTTGQLVSVSTEPPDAPIRKILILLVQMGILSVGRAAEVLA